MFERHVKLCMKKTKILIFRKSTASILCAAILLILSLPVFLWAYFSNLPANMFTDPKNGIIAIDPGHGGIDGGTNRNGILEKEINLAIALRLKKLLEEKGYQVVMTREEDVSLEKPYPSGQSRHRRDLNARVGIINSSNAQIFLSIHVNCNIKRPSTDGAIVFYSNHLTESRELAYSVQRALNAMEINGVKRTVHDPVQAKFYLLRNTRIPGLIVETAFLSNSAERLLLTKDSFREQLAKAIADGAVHYLNKPE